MFILQSSFLKFVADLFTEIYGSLESVRDKNCDTECPPVYTSPCGSTEPSTSCRTDNVEHANEASHVIGQEPISDEVNPVTHRVSGCESSSRSEEINNNLFAFEGATSTPIHREDVWPRLPHLPSEANVSDINHLLPESYMSDTKHLCQEAHSSHSDYPCEETSNNYGTLISHQIHSSAVESFDSTHSIDFNLLDDDLDIAVMEKLAAEHDVVLPSGCVETSKQDGHFQRSDSCVLDFLSDAPRGDVGCEDVAEKWSRGETVVDEDGNAAQVSLLL